MENSGQELAEQVKALAELFRSRSLIGQVLRVLSCYCRNPRTTYAEDDLALLLLISTAEIQAGRTERGPQP